MQEEIRCGIKANHSRKDYIFQKNLCKNTAEILQEKNMKKVNVPEAYVGPFQLSMMGLCVKIVKDFRRLLFLQKYFHRIRSLIGS